MLALFLALPAWAGSASSKDPLFANMLGEWIGQGARQAVESPSVTQLQAQVQTTEQTVDGQLELISRNQITETATDGSSRNYSSNYWIRPVRGQPGRYELGQIGIPQATGWGYLDPEGDFHVRQEMQVGTTPMTLDSVTHFSPGSADYSETTTVGQETEFRAEIRYQRAAQ